MRYISTRNPAYSVTAAEAILSGLAPDGGLFLPEEFSNIRKDLLLDLAKKDYTAKAAAILGLFLDDFTPEELQSYVRQAYCAKNFTAQKVAPVVKLQESAYILELFHGPTCAFKDFALQILPFLLTAASKKCRVDKDVIILVATSGDTGKAALEGFADVAGTKICVFFPHGGTSNIQRLQMTTQEGNNVMVAAVEGNFDDAQTGVKKIFTDTDYKKKLSEKGYLLSSANSINWGRLAPQIAYYVSAYCDLINQGVIHAGDPINVTVPTGNFGNILAAYFAKCCGLPIRRFICASNHNNVLTEFITSGVYDRNRPFYVTTSPSMDILISSNLERLLFLLCDRNAEKLCGYMNQLKESGKYTVDATILSRLQEDFSAGCADDKETADTIRRVFTETGYLLDPHTAVGVKVYEDYRKQSGDTTPTVLASTASPFKFCGSVLRALGKATSEDDFAMLQEVAALSGRSVPPRLAELAQKKERFTGVIAPDAMEPAIETLL